jgi:transcriptional regulator with XRE-family HTH domain
MTRCVTCDRPLSRYSPGPECAACTQDARNRIGEPPTIDPAFWEDPRIRRAAHQRDLQTLIRAYLDATGLTQEALALLIDRDQGTISKIIRGQRKRYTIEDLETIRDGIHMPGHLLGLLPGPHESPPPRTRSLEPAVEKPARGDSGDILAGSLMNVGCSTSTGDENVQRRQLFQLATLGLTASVLSSSGEAVRQLLNLHAESEFRSLDDWYLTLSDHLYAIRTQPARHVRDGLLIDLTAVQHQLKSANLVDVVELHRITAGLAILCSNVLTRLGEHGAAIRWCRTARASADASRDLDLQLMIRGEEAKFGLYGQRDPNSILLLLDHAEHLAGSSQSTQKFRIADFKSTRAKALTLLGRDAEAKKSLDEFISSVADAPQVNGSLLPNLWQEDQIYFAESWVYAHTGDEARSDIARSNVLRLTADYQYIANARLHEALCAVVNGGVSNGTGRASEVLNSLPAAQRTCQIIHTARRVLNAVPTENHEDSTVRDLRELTTSVSRSTE